MLGEYPGRLTRWAVLGSYFAALLAFAASLVLTFEGRWLWVTPLGDVSCISVGSVAVIYALGQYRFGVSGYSEMKSVVLGVLFANAFLQCYELVYGLTFGLSALLSDPPTLTGTALRTFILWLIMISPILLVREYLRSSGPAQSCSCSPESSGWHGSSTDSLNTTTRGTRSRRCPRPPTPSISAYG